MDKRGGRFGSCGGGDVWQEGRGGGGGGGGREGKATIERIIENRIRGKCTVLVLVVAMRVEEGRMVGDGRTGGEDVSTYVGK